MTHRPPTSCPLLLGNIIYSQKVRRALRSRNATRRAGARSWRAAYGVQTWPAFLAVRTEERAGGWASDYWPLPSHSTTIIKTSISADRSKALVGKALQRDRARNLVIAGLCTCDMRNVAITVCFSPV